MSVPNSSTFKMSDVVAEIGGGTGLQNLFSLATGAFNPTYEGSKDRLLNFRDYTHAAVPVIDTTAFVPISGRSAQNADAYLGTTFTPDQNLSNFYIEMDVATKTGNPIVSLELSLTSTSGGLPVWPAIIAVSSDLYPTNAMNPGDTLTYNFSGLNLLSGTLYAWVLRGIGGGQFNINNFYSFSRTQGYTGGFETPSVNGGASFIQGGGVTDSMSFKLYQV